MIRFAFSLLLTLCCGAVYAEPPACKPNYEVIRTACKASGEVVKWQTTYPVDTHPGACNEPNGGWMALCLERVPGVAQNYPAGTRVEALSATRKELDFKFCKGNKKKSDILCAFKVEAPEYKMVTHESCPIGDVLEVSGCYSKEVVVVDPSVVDECLKLNPKAIDEWWIKAACLMDLSEAARSFSSEGISTENMDQLDRQLKIASRATLRADLEPVNNYLLVRQRKLNR